MPESLRALPTGLVSGLNGAGWLISSIVSGRCWPMLPTYPTVSTFGPNCCSSCRLNCWISALLKFGAWATNDRFCTVVRFVTTGAAGSGSPASKVDGADPEHAGFWPERPLADFASICTASADWQLGL